MMKIYLVIVACLLNCPIGSGQNPDLVDKYLKSVEYEAHKLEAYKIHNDLIKGLMSPEVLALLVDSSNISPYPNRQVVEELQNDDQFRFHSARIDTSVAMGATPYFTAIRFRDIYYLGNNQFREYFIQISIGWNPENLKTTGRSISFYTFDVPSRKAWGRGIWHNEQGIYNGLEK